jgi:hypothetical protein
MAAHLLWELVRRHLEERRRPVEAEIRRYPPPIAGCDAHFNYLLEQRALFSRELVRLAEAMRKDAADAPSAAGAADAFIRSSACIDEAAAEEIRTQAMDPALSDITRGAAPVRR